MPKIGDGKPKEQRLPAIHQKYPKQNLKTTSLKLFLRPKCLNSVLAKYTPPIPFKIGDDWKEILVRIVNANVPFLLERDYLM